MQRSQLKALVIGLLIVSVVSCVLFTTPESKKCEDSIVIIGKDTVKAVCDSNVITPQSSPEKF